MKNFRENKHAQLTIFIIIALVIIAVLLFLFYPRIKTIVAGTSPSDYIKSCTETAAKEALDKLSLQGGSLEPENYILYQDSKVEYACYTNEYYKRCLMQKPFLKQDIEEEINAYIEPKVKQCFSSFKSQLESRGSFVSVGEIQVDTAIVPNSIIVTVNAPTTIRKEAAVSFNKFKTDIKSQMYDLIMLSSSISNYEARYGNSDTLTYMLYYPNIKIEKNELSDGSRVYVLTDRDTNEKFMFASRSVVFPAGNIGGVLEK